MGRDYNKIIGVSEQQIIILKEKITLTCREHLDKAERDWIVSGADSLVESRKNDIGLDSISVEDQSSLIPGYEIINPFEPKVDEFIAIVCDLRDSSKRISTINNSYKINGIQRIFYETSALLPVIEITLEHFGGKVTEYLGDGTLGFIKYIDDEQIYAAHKFSKCCLTLSLDIVNELLKERYSLPALQIGIGLAFSKALIRVVTKNHVKAFGECVWRATKLSNGYNKVNIDEKLKAKWPKAIGGGLSFTKTTHDKLTGYRLYPQK